MDGVVNLLKPAGMTSHDAVAAARRIFGQRRIGHGGTLDPGACGVLPLFLGWATRLVSYMPSDKRYRAEMTLGISTDTQDSGGTTLEVAENVEVTPWELGTAFADFVGGIEQIPPMTSAIRQEGRRLYELAREGKVVERQPRTIEIYDLHICKIWPEDATTLGLVSRVLFDVHCSSGTYVRTLCVDIGARLGCPAHMSFLVRTACGPLDLPNAVTFEELLQARAEARLTEYVLPPTLAVEHMPAIYVDERQMEYILSGHGFRAETPERQTEVARVHDKNQSLIALAKPADRSGYWQPIRVFPQSIT